MGEARARRLAEEAGLPIIRAREEVKFKPVLDRIFVEEIPVKESRIVTAGGLALERSERFEKKPMTGRVLAVGDGVPMAGVLLPMPYAVGQVVRCSEYGREYVNLKTGENGVNAFQQGEPRTFLIRVADTHGVMA
jgi:co-chaperonin GroES (HSP10)